MRKILYVIYAFSVITFMSVVVFSPTMAQSTAANANSYYHGSTTGSGGSGGVHK